MHLKCEIDINDIHLFIKTNNTEMYKSYLILFDNNVVGMYIVVEYLGT